MDGEYDKNYKFLGCGIQFPLKVDKNGCLVMNSMEDHVRQSILIILKTAAKERVMNPQFGAGLKRYVFSNMIETTRIMIKRAVTDALIENEPRIEVLDVDPVYDPQNPGLINIGIQYRINMTDTLQNLVYPFYLEKGEV